MRSHDISHIFQTALESASASSDPQVRLLIILNALAARLDAPVGVVSLSIQPEGPGSIRLLQLVDIGVWDARERQVRDEYMSSPDHKTDPFLAKIIELNLQQGPQNAIRQDYLSDDEWYGSEHFQQFRKRANQDSAIYCCMPAAFEGKPSIPADHIWALCLCRKLNQPQFTPAERDFAGSVFGGLRPLLAEIWCDRSASWPRSFDGLPPRLRRVAGLLMAGDSERQVAEALHLSPHTVHGYVKELYRLYDVTSRSKLILKMMEATHGQPQEAP